MSNFFKLKVLLVATLIGLPFISPAQSTGNIAMPDTKMRPSTSVNATEAAPTLDAEVIIDPVWQHLTPLSNWWFFWL